jgi:molybdopterin molybdotransferase
MSAALPWPQAREAAHAAGAALLRPVVKVPLEAADGTVLAEPIVARTALPAFPTSSVDGYAVRGTGPWRLVGRILAGHPAAPLDQDSTGVEIATGAMVPDGAEQIVRSEDATQLGDGRIDGAGRHPREWRMPGDEASFGEELLAAGTVVTPAVIGLAASCGYDHLMVRSRPVARVVVFGDELLTSGLPAAGRVRDSLGVSVPSWLRRLGATVSGWDGPVTDTLDAHVAALRAALDTGADLICTTGGTMVGPVDHLDAALRRVGARDVVRRVLVRPGYPMLLTTVPRPDGGVALLAGLPGNPQSAVIALCTLVAPALYGMLGRSLPRPRRTTLAAPVPGRGESTHLALVQVGNGLAHPVGHAGSAMLRGLAGSAGFAMVPPHQEAAAGDEVDLLVLPLLEGEATW